MPKAILTLDEINLLRHSEEPKNQDLYGNLYDVLCNIKTPKAFSLNQLDKLDDKAISALTINKKNLIETITQEWFAERVSEEDPSKQVRCGLCNTPNKYLYYIRNRKNGEVLNVGSHCITKFPGIEGYVEQKRQLAQIHKGHQIIKRRNEFYDAFPNCEELINKAESYFNSLPILLPYNLYFKMQNLVLRLRLIYSKYVNEGKKPFQSNKSSIELFGIAIEEFKTLKEKADKHINSFCNKRLVCKRTEIDWMIKNNKLSLLEQISEHDGLYTFGTLQKMNSIAFITFHEKEILSKNKSEYFRFQGYNGNNLVFTFKRRNYTYPVQFTINASDFMRTIGASTLTNSSYVYRDQELLEIAKITNSYRNILSVIDYTRNIIDELGCAFLFDAERNALILYRKSDKAIRNFDYFKFLSAYSKHFLDTDKALKNYFTAMIYKNSHAKWTLIEEQAKYGIDERIGKLYKEYLDITS